MKTLLTFTTCFLVALGVQAQSYPPDPSIAQIASHLKADQEFAKNLTYYGYDASYAQTGKFRFAQKSELKDYFYVKWYGRSKYAYKVSLNENWMDRRFFSVFLVTPKDKNGVSHKIFFEVEYSRLTPEYFEDKKWNYRYHRLRTNECEMLGLPKITDEQRKKMMLEWLEANRTHKDYESPYGVLSRISKIDSILAPSHSVRYMKSRGGNTFHWTLVFRGEYAQDINSEGGVERFDKGYYKLSFDAVYENGGYKVKQLLLTNDYWDTYLPGYKTMYDQLGGNLQTRLDPPEYYGNLRTEGVDAIYGKFVKKSTPIHTKTYVTKRMAEIEAAFKLIGEDKLDEAKQALTALCDPKDAKKIAESYIDMIQDWNRKMCTVNNVYFNDRIPYSMSEDVAEIKADLKISCNREKASTKALQQKYKSAGMSRAVLKSTSRGSEYGKYSGTYRGDLVVRKIGDNWYLVTPADTEELNIRF